jgi:hypothetical protein
MKICPVGAELFHADGRTDMTKLIAALHNFANAPNKIWHAAWCKIDIIDSIGTIDRIDSIDSIDNTDTIDSIDSIPVI